MYRATAPALCSSISGYSDGPRCRQDNRCRHTHTGTDYGTGWGNVESIRNSSRSRQTDTSTSADAQATACRPDGGCRRRGGGLPRATGQRQQGAFITSIVYWTGPNRIPVRYSEGFHQHRHDLRQILGAALLRPSRSVRRRRPDALRHHGHAGLLTAHQRQPDNTDYAPAGDRHNVDCLRVLSVVSVRPSYPSSHRHPRRSASRRVQPIQRKELIHMKRHLKFDRVRGSDTPGRLWFTHCPGANVAGRGPGRASRHE